MVASTAIATPIPKPNSVAPFVDPQSGALSQHGLTLMSQWHGRSVGTARIIPCNASGKNLITLTPLAPSPTITKFDAFDTHSFVAAITSDGPVTATVIPAKGVLSTIKVFIKNGSAQAGAGDVTAGLHYHATYVDTLDSGQGGLVLR